MTSEKKFDQIKYQNEYNRKNYDHINIMVAKGKKDIVKAKAKEKEVKKAIEEVRSMAKKGE